MTDREVLNIYTAIVPFLGNIMGKGTEVVIHDIANPEHSLIAICNPISGRKIGDSMTDLATELVKQSAYIKSEYMSNYKAHNKCGDFLSSTFYIKNGGRLIGLLCINKNMAGVHELDASVKALLKQFNLCPSQESNYLEDLDTPMISMMRTQIADIISKNGVAPARMSIEEKVRIVHQLEGNGVLAMKGSITELANQLSVSIPTIYRYLNKPNIK